MELSKTVHLKDIETKLAVRRANLWMSLSNLKVPGLHCVCTSQNTYQKNWLIRIKNNLERLKVENIEEWIKITKSIKQSDKVDTSIKSVDERPVNLVKNLQRIDMEVASTEGSVAQSRSDITVDNDSQSFKCPKYVRNFNVKKSLVNHGYLKHDLSYCKGREVGRIEARGSQPQDFPLPSDPDDPGAPSHGSQKI